MLKHYFDPNQRISRVVIIGLGGTGAQVARILGRMCYDMREKQYHTPKIVLIDPDKIEVKNVGRQLFVSSDVNQYKAAIVAKRLNFGLGLDVAWYPEAVSADKHFDRYGSDLVISCVDNFEARREIYKVSGIHLSAGNYSTGGQVCIGNTNDVDLIERYFEQDRIRYLPKEGLLLPELLEAEDPLDDPVIDDTLSCAELVQAEEQSLLINDWMANIVGQYAYKLLHRQPIYHFMTFLDCDTLSMRSLPISKEELEVYLPKNKE
ncbi:MAG: ThiF family adenylyltransferase [Phototrophicaceae bacterium]